MEGGTEGGTTRGMEGGTAMAMADEGVGEERLNLSISHPHSVSISLTMRHPRAS